MGRKEDLIVGLDIGTTKVCAIVAEPQDGGIDVIGIGTHPSRGLRKGVVVDIDATVESIKKAVEEAELMADCEIASVYAGIAGGHIRGMNSHGIVAVKEREVSETDLRRVIDAAKAVAIPMDREVIHVIPQEFIIDGQDGIREPLGMAGVRLEAKIHIVTAAVTSAQNIVKCANKAGLNVIDIVLEPLASAEAVLAGDERDLGVCLIDIGGGTTDIAVFAEGSIQHTSVLGLGGSHVTNDIAVGLRTPYDEAERIKKKFGMAAARFLTSDDVISVPSVGGRRPREVSRKILCEIIEARVDEILSLARQELLKAGSRSSRRRSSRARCGAASRPTWAGSRTWCGARCTRPASGWCCSARVRPASASRAGSGSGTSRSSGGSSSGCASGSMGRSSDRDHKNPHLAGISWRKTTDSVLEW
jgi:cell division protein FtsA